MTIKQISNEFLNLFFPRVCVVCEERLLQEEKGICLSCQYELPKTGNYKQKNNKMDALLEGRFPHFDRAASFCVFTKQGVMQAVIHHIKYNHGTELGFKMGKLFGNEIKGSEFISSVDAIIPIPLHPKKQKQRGYNQAEIIANGMGEALNLPIIRHVLVRSIHNPTQTKRTKTQRWENVDGIFTIADAKILEDKHILLVDDVMTTGSTLEAAADALVKIPNIKISVATLAEAQ